MLKSVLILTLFGSTISFAGTPKLPSSLTCNRAMIRVDGNFSDSLYTFADLNGTAPRVKSQSRDAKVTKGYYETDMSLQGYDRKSDDLILDFSQGDQYQFFIFKGIDLAKLANGEIPQVNATFEDGFDWTNGYNTRSQEDFICR